MYNKTVQNIYDKFARQCDLDLRENLRQAKLLNKEDYEIEEIKEKGDKEWRLSYLNDSFDALTRCMNFSNTWDAWYHINLENTLEDRLNNYSSDWYDYINRCADKYFADSEFRDEELDWLYLELLFVGCYKNYQKNEQLNNRLLEYFPTIKKVIDYFANGKYIQLAIYLIFTTSVFLVKLLIVGVLLYQGSDNYALSALGVIFILIYFYNKNKNYKRITDLMDAGNNELQAKLSVVKKVYSLLSTKNIHWDILEDEVNNARHQGIEIPSAIIQPSKLIKIAIYKSK
jgi:hypothetical protein